MKVSKNKKFNIKSENGFTMQDLMIAAFLIIIFVSFISTIMYTVVKANIKTDLTAQMTTYAVQILEDIDKISYEEVDNSLAQTYLNKFSIPSGYDIIIDVSNYGEGLNNVQDVIKIVKLTISYELQGVPEKITIQKLKIKEI